jgi:hypothetical protein
MAQNSGGNPDPLLSLISVASPFDRISRRPPEIETQYDCADYGNGGYSLHRMIRDKVHILVSLLSFKRVGKRPPDKGVYS